MQQAQSQAVNASADGAAGISAGAARPWAFLCELLRCEAARKTTWRHAIRVALGATSTIAADEPGHHGIWAFLLVVC